MTDDRWLRAGPVSSNELRYEITSAGLAVRADRAAELAVAMQHTRVFERRIRRLRFVANLLLGCTLGYWIIRLVVAVWGLW